jgi:acetolactate synthase-1/2/3 large subunit
MLNIQELSTLKYLNPKNFILIILNNNGYESIKISQKRNFGFIGGCDLSSGLKIPDYKKISKAFGLRYFRIFNRNNLVKLNDIILSNRGPTIVEINLDTNEYRGPSVKTIISRDGKIKSTSLNNINW